MGAITNPFQEPTRYDLFLPSPCGGNRDAAGQCRGCFAASLRQRLDFGAIRGKSGGMISNTPVQLHPAALEQIAFHRTELALLMGLYGRMVAAGEWRDYGLSFLRDVAVFSVFKHTAENPIYKVEKRPKLRLKQGQYAVIGMDGQVLKRGNDLRQVLRVLDRKLIRAVD